jgi:HAT1-interacting factor 1
VLAAAAASKAEPEARPAAKISFSGDAEDDGEDNDNEDNDDEEPEKEKDVDFQIAWEVLEAAKLMFESLLEARKSIGLRTPEVTSIERKIADACDLLGEVSIENGPPSSVTFIDSRIF